MFGRAHRAGVLPRDTPLSALIPTNADEASPSTSSSDRRGPRPSVPPVRQFSDFHLTTHLHVPLLRLVYTPFQLQVTFTHMPGIPENFRYTWFISARLTAADVLEAILDEFGVRKLVTQGSKSARVEYSLCVDGKRESR